MAKTSQNMRTKLMKMEWQKFFDISH